MKKNKGFTLVEVIVILVILAILAAVLIPSLTTYIDKAREKNVTANARATYVAAQALLSEAYGKYDDFTAGKSNNKLSDADDVFIELSDHDDITADALMNLAQLQFGTADVSGIQSVTVTYEATDAAIDKLEYVEIINSNEYTATWNDGVWTVKKADATPATT